MLLRPYTMLGDQNGMILSTNICQKDKKSGTLRWSRDVQDFPMCQKCDTSSFHSDTVDSNLEIECVPDKSVRYRQSCKVQCKAGHSLFVAGSYKEFQGCKFVSRSVRTVRIWFRTGFSQFWVFYWSRLGMMYAKLFSVATELRCKCEDDFCEKIGWKVFNPNRKNEIENGVFMNLNDPFITKNDLACL